MRKILENRMLISVSLSVALSFALVFAAAYSATTISTNVSTGNLTVTGTANITGVTTMINASSTNITNGGILWNTGNATIGGTLGVTGITTLVHASTTSFTTTGLASTTQLVVGGTGGTVMSGVVFGYCNIGNITITASSTVGVTCAAATGVRVNDRIFVQATSSLPTNFVILSASSTATDGQIGLYIHNLGYPGFTASTLGTSINFWAVR